MSRSTLFATVIGLFTAGVFSVQSIHAVNCLSPDGAIRDSYFFYYADDSVANNRGGPSDTCDLHGLKSWTSTTTGCKFQDTGVTFAMTLGPATAEYTKAGTGYNGYVDFTCYTDNLHYVQYPGDAGIQYDGECESAFYCLAD
ncbi:hypothetical protein BX600DRAFT_537754 [Xylariales sp. PMI_506]|nr:hypothetical protein BX600DRAFT_537754 [Xylariales sp. PMI_506]